MKRLIGILIIVTLCLGVVLGLRADTQAATPTDPSYLPYGMPVSPEHDVSLTPEPYDPAVHGPPISNTQPGANMAKRSDVTLPVHPNGARPSPSGQLVPIGEPGSGDRGLWLFDGAGIYVGNDAQTNLAIPATAIGTTIYAPTNMAAGNSCIETVTAHWYYDGMTGTAHGHGFWDFCAVDGTGGWQVFEFMDTTWTAKYVRKRNGEGRYWTQVYRDGSCWKGMLYNFQQGRWEEKTTICGSGPFASGWTMWESHYLMDQAAACPVLPSIRASDLRLYAGNRWIRLTNSNTGDLGPYGLCWDNGTYTFRVSQNRDGWSALTP